MTEQQDIEGFESKPISELSTAVGRRASAARGCGILGFWRQGPAALQLFSLRGFFGFISIMPRPSYPCCSTYQSPQESPDSVRRTRNPENSPYPVR
jgi:hypothetical protein